jgi:phytoene dehydrogenase-like protein
VTDVDAATVYRDLLPTPRRLGRLAGRSLSGFVLLLGVRGRSGMAHHTVYFPADYDAEFDAVFGGRPAVDPAVYVTVPPDTAPPGYEAWTVLVNAAPHWRRADLAEAYADHLLDVLAARGVDVRDRLVFREVRPPGEPIYGTAGGLLRPSNRGPVAGMYLVGGSVHPGGGLPLVTLSADLVAKAAMDSG